MKVTLISNKFGCSIELDCLYWDFSDRGNVYQFYYDKEGKVMKACYSVYNWDLEHIEYETTPR